jgi:2-oxoglutarate/2-oxoacid ferredoxin oxidoreductase subunit alpha
MGRNVGRLPLVFEQAEDEIAAIHMAMGASFAGVRSMVATSGGGFSLMVEGLSLAGCTETPLVIFPGQRPGPATGLATRTEQGTFSFALHAGHGEFPRAILAPGNPVGAFWLTVKAFNLAEKYQIPVFILSDQYLADALYTVEPFYLSRSPGGQGRNLTEKDLQGSRLPSPPAYGLRASPPGLFPAGETGRRRPRETSTMKKDTPRKRDLRKSHGGEAAAQSPALAKEMAGPAFYGAADPQRVLF